MTIAWRVLLAATLFVAAPLPLWADAGAAPAAGIDDAAEINPRYLLMDARGRAVSDEDFAGRFQLLTFGYTSCPDVCPGTLAAMAVILAKLGKLAGQVQPIFISVDPERDSVEMLRRYTENFDPRILALSGSPELLRSAADHYRVTYTKQIEPGAGPNQYSVDHTVGMYLLGPDGRFLTRYAYTAAPAEIAAKIRARIEAEAETRQ